MKKLKKILYIFMLVFAINMVLPANTMIFTGNVQANAAITINKKTATLIKGQSVALKIKGTKKKAKWTSSNSKIAKVASNGKVTAKAKGTATITATVSGKKYECKIIVETPSISKTKQTAYVGQKITLKINGTKQKVVWKTSNKKIATVNGSGDVVLKKKGSVTITATVAKKSYKCKITVKNAVRVNSFSLGYNSLRIKEGEFQNINYYLSPSNATNKKITWSSSDSSVAKVDADGNVFGISPGNAIITAICDGKKAICTVNVARYFNEITAAKSISYTSYKTSQGVVVTVKNNYEYVMSLNADCLYYDKSGNLIGKSTDTIYGFESGKENVLYFDNPYDANYRDVEYAKYKIVFHPEETFVFGNYDGISLSSNFGSGNVMVTVKNNGRTNEYTYVTIVFYKNGNPVGCNAQYADVETKGKVDTLKFDFPFDNQFNTIYPNSYKLYVTSYAYDWSM